MNDFVIRQYSIADIPQMCAVWTRSFGDPAEMVSDFLCSLPEHGSAVVAVSGGKIIGSAYALTGMELVDTQGQTPLVCGYLFAIAVDSEARHMGAGGALTIAAAELARQRGADIICVEPATEALFAWYEKLLGVRCVLRRSKREISGQAMEPVRSISSGEYSLLREKLLENRPHVRHCAGSLEAQQKMLAAFGGGFYAVGKGIAAASISDGAAVISELLCEKDGTADALAASVGAAMGFEKILLLENNSQGAPYMAADRIFPENCIWNLSFD